MLFRVLKGTYLKSFRILKNRFVRVKEKYNPPSPMLQRAVFAVVILDERECNIR